MQKITLNFKDRLNIMSNFPKNGDMALINLIVSINNKIKIDKEELEKNRASCKQNGAEVTVNWPDEINTDREFEFDDKEIETLKQITHMADQNKRITINNIDTFKKILDINKDLKIVQDKT